VEREPYDGSTPSRFDARSSRIYRPEPESEPEHYGHIPPRPQARWLPDPEPGYGEPGQVPPPRPSRPRPSHEDLEQAAPEGLEAPWERVVPGQPVREPAEPLDFRGEKPAPWERVSGGVQAPRETAKPAPAFEPVSEPVIGRVSVPDEGGLPPEFAMPGPGELPPPRGPAGQPREEDAQEDLSGEGLAGEVQPSEAVAGDESVRDIWARLQAMSGGVKPQSVEEGREEPAGERSMPIGPDTVAPWEQLEHYGVVPAFMATAKNVLMRPGDFFDQLPPASGKARPLIFAMTACLLAMMAGLVWNYFGLGPNLSELGRTDGFQGLGAGAIGGLALLGLAPLALLAFVFLDASLTQLLLTLLRSSSRSFEETFRTVCYAGTPWLLAVLPVPYSYLIPVVLIWHMTLQAIGLKKLHGSGYPQVLASVLVKWSLYFMASFAVLHVLITRR
jgi:hypothetical protein